MKLMNTLLVVRDIDQSVSFYKNVLGLDVVMDFGANKTLTGGLVLQTLDTYKEFIGTDCISFGGDNMEIYFEEDDFDSFIHRLDSMNIEYVHPVMEHSWDKELFVFMIWIIILLK